MRGGLFRRFLPRGVKVRICLGLVAHLGTRIARFDFRFQRKALAPALSQFQYFLDAGGFTNFVCVAMRNRVSNPNLQGRRPTKFLRPQMTSIPSPIKIKSIQFFDSTAKREDSRCIYGQPNSCRRQEDPTLSNRYMHNSRFAPVHSMRSILWNVFQTQNNCILDQ